MKYVLLNKKGQMDISDAFIGIMLLAIILVALVNVLPVLLDNYITPQIQNRTFGTLSIFFYEMIPLLFVIGIIIFAMKFFGGLGRGQQQ